MYTVYKHTTPSNKVYIGLTKQTVSRRWRKGEGYRKNIHFIERLKNMDETILNTKYWPQILTKRMQNDLKYN